MKNWCLVFIVAAVSSPIAAQYGFNDGGFDAQGAAVGSYCYFSLANCPAGAWTGGQAGLVHSSNIDWGGYPSPSPSTHAFIQMTGSLSQSFNATQNKRVRFTWLEADRPYAGGQTYHVMVNGLMIGVFTSGGTSFVRRYSSSFDVLQGTWYTVTFTGETQGVDRSALIDSVRLTADDSVIQHSYDALGRLTSSSQAGGLRDGTVSSYAFDSAGNRTAVQFTGVQP